MATPIKAILILVVVASLARADTAATLLRGLDTDDPVSLSNAVAEIERARAPETRELADTLFAAGRACEDRLHDPVRALALYERIVREFPDASVAIAAARRIKSLGPIHGRETQARLFALTVANADAWPPPIVIATATAVRIPDASAWLAAWLCRKGQYAAAQKLYTDPRDAAGCAIEAGNYALAKKLASTLPEDDANRAIKRDLLSAASRGQTRARLYDISWIALALSSLTLLASLLDALLRGGWRHPTLRPPIEVLFLVPLALVVLATTYATQRTIWPAVARITLVGIALTWISGATLDALRARSRPIRLRSMLHVLAVAVAVLATGYIAVTRDGLIEMFVETLRFGPEEH